MSDLGWASSTNWLVRSDPWRQQPVSLLEGTLSNEERHFSSISCSCRSGNLSKKTRLRKTIPTPKRVAIAWWRLVGGGSFRDVATQFDVGKSTCVKITREFCHALNRLSRYFIKFPATCRETTIFSPIYLHGYQNIKMALSSTRRFPAKSK